MKTITIPKIIAGMTKLPSRQHQNNVTKEEYNLLFCYNNITTNPFTFFVELLPRFIKAWS